MYLMVPKFELFPFKTHTTTVNIHESGRSLGTGVQREVESGAFRIIMMDHYGDSSTLTINTVKSGIIKIYPGGTKEYISFSMLL